MPNYRVDEEGLIKKIASVKPGLYMLILTLLLYSGTRLREWLKNVI